MKEDKSILMLPSGQKVTISSPSLRIAAQKYFVIDHIDYLGIGKQVSEEGKNYRDQIDELMRVWMEEFRHRERGVDLGTKLGIL